MVFRSRPRTLCAIALLCGLIFFSGCSERSGAPLPSAMATDPIPLQLAAFAHLYGIVRWFHPSDQAFEADWNHLAIEGVQSIIHMPEGQPLDVLLEDVFSRVAPTLRVFPTGQLDGIPSTLRKPEDASQVHMLQWEHIGLGTEHSPNLGGIYSSHRRHLSDVISHDTVDPRNPLRIDLPASISAWCATALYADSHGTFPQVETSPARVPASTSEIVEYAPMLADAIVVWNVIQHFYPYFDLLDCDWDRVLIETLSNIIAHQADYSLDDLKADLLIPLRDGHASLRSGMPIGPRAIPDLAISQVDGNIVIAASAGSAREQGLLPGMRIQRIDDLPVESAVSKTRARFSGGEHRVEALALFYLLVGDLDSTLELVAETTQGQYETFTLSRTRRTPLINHSFDPVEELEPGVVYVDVTRASEEDLSLARQQAQNAETIIVDARGYPRNRFWARWLLPSETSSMRLRIPVIRAPYHRHIDYKETTMHIAPVDEAAIDSHFVFLINPLTLSAGEHQLSYFKEAGIGTFIGTPSAGANGDINRLTLPSGGTFTWTGMVAEWTDGTTFHGVGIQPDLFVVPTLEGIRQEWDEWIQAAWSLVRAGDV